MRNFKISDFEGGGHYLVRTTKKYIEDNGFLSTITFKVGYMYKIPGFLSQQVITLTSMSDGWTRIGNIILHDKHGNKLHQNDWGFNTWKNDDLGDKLGLAKFVLHLNSEHTQEMRFATKEEIIRVVSYSKTRYKN